MANWIEEFKTKWGFMPISGGAPEPVQVELESKEEVKPVVVEKKEEPQYVKVEDLKKLSKQLDGMSTAWRTSEKEKKELSKKLEDLEGRLSGRAIKPSDAQDELDALIEQGDWRTPVSRVTEDTVNRILKQREAEQHNAQQSENRTKKYESAVNTVYERYPELKDPTSDITKTWLKVVNDHPEWHGEPLGPIAAMHAMEEILDTEDLTNTSNETKRRQRVNATSVRPGTPAKTSTITLTREQKEFCKSSGLSEESYLKTLKGMSGPSKEIE